MSAARDEELTAGLPGRRAGGVVVLGISYLYESQGAEGPPEIMTAGRMTVRASDLRDLAYRLAMEGREDADAIGRLRRAAGILDPSRRRDGATPLEHVAVGIGLHAKDLKCAAAFACHDWWMGERRVADRTCRLLQAAASNQRSVVPISAEQDAWFDEVEAFVGLPGEVAFYRLVALRPGIPGLQRSIADQVAALDDENTLDENAIWSWIVEGLKPFVGPEARSEDRLVRSEVASWRARTWIGRSVGLHLDDDEEEWIP
jgi:hypothetical protein